MNNVRIEADNIVFSYGEPRVLRNISLGIEAGELYDEARESVRRFINAPSTEEIVFVRNTTEALNLIARSYAEPKLKKGDKIVIPISEHHSNLVTWQRVCEKTGAVLEFMYLDKEGHFTRQTDVVFIGLFHQDRHTCFQFRRLDGHCQAPAET